MDDVKMPTNGSETDGPGRQWSSVNARGIDHMRARKQIAAVQWQARKGAVTN